ncbi:MAG: DMT family transporter [Oscillospiraceae bacterium]|nr:DMT family transporter [Oscillospiraceae bacterium]
MAKQRRAELLLVLATAFWSISYYFSRVCLEELDVLNLNAFRFLSAFAILGAVYRKHLRALTRETLKWGAIIGVVLVFVYVGATYGVKYTSLSNAGFISCLAVITTPLIELLVYRKKPEKKLAAALLLCTLGLALLTLSGGTRFAIGDAICLLCSVAYGADIVITDRAIARPEVDPIGMSVVEIGVTGVLFLLLSSVFEQPRLPRSPSVWGAALFLGLFCSGLAFVIQTTQQKHTAPARVALIFTLEPLFSAIIAYFLAGERLHPRAYLGAALMLLSLLLMQADFKGGKADDDVRQGV